MKILVTGASGFVGRCMYEHLKHKGLDVLGLSRKAIPGFREIGDISTIEDWKPHLDGIDCVIHLAAITRTISHDEQEFFDVNVRATSVLAEQAAKNGVRRFIFVSSIKVNGEVCSLGRPFRYSDIPHPVSLYGKSKLASEKYLMRLSENTDMDVVVIRPPVIYGEAVKGNMHALVKLIDNSVPIPLGAVRNRRSFIYVGNLVDFISHCISAKTSSYEVFLVGDDFDLSTCDFMRIIADSRRKRIRVVRFPIRLLEFCFSLFGKKAMFDSLAGSAYLDSSYAKKIVGWSPPYKAVDMIEKSFAVNGGQDG